MKVLIVVLCVLIASLAGYSFATGYRSAFEADQACHSQQWNDFGENSGFGCDHDLETNQWLLYEIGSNHQAAKVIKRFRY